MNDLLMGRKHKRRGFVMTGGGAKGLYEAGVIHAFHLTGMEFDVITGSSIGAFNAIFYAEYLLKKRRLSTELLTEPEMAMEAMDNLVKAYHNAWLQLPERKIVDDSETGPLGKLMDDLVEFNISLPDLLNILWWWTDPNRNALPSPRVWPALIKLGKESVERLGGPGEVLKLLKNTKTVPHQSIVTYLSRFQMDKSLVASEDAQKLSLFFTDPIEPLKAEPLIKAENQSRGSDPIKLGLVSPNRTLKDYSDEGIDVRLTRANYRTGRLEISAYISKQDFAHYLQKHAFRLEKSDPNKIPLGSFRIHIPGNPNAIGAALASGRFPGVFVPFPIEKIYLPDDTENNFLHKMLAHWFDHPEIGDELVGSYLAGAPKNGDAAKKLRNSMDRWQRSQKMREYFPRSQDVYVDGGAIDNTPYNSAIDATRDWIEKIGESKRNYELELFVIYLHEEPLVEPADVKSPILHEVVQRTLEIQGAAQKTSSAVVVNTINSFGNRAEKLGVALSVLLKIYQQQLESLEENKKKDFLDLLRNEAKEAGLRGFLGKNGEGIINRMDVWSSDIISQRLPLHVKQVEIYPDVMPMSTLQFTERLGFKQENAIQMLAMGCSNTLWALFKHLNRNWDELDSQDKQVFSLTSKWIDLSELPNDPEEQETLRRSWKCQRTICSFFDSHCPHGNRN